MLCTLAEETEGEKMSEVKGKLCTCDRCGETCFIRTIGEGETDGGFTRWNKFEPYPEGWGFVRANCIGMLCPKCNAEWERIVCDFMRRAKHEK